MVVGGFYWLDQTPVDWTFWSRNEPNDEYDSEACVEMVWRDNGHWNDCNCENRLHFLCEKPAGRCGNVLITMDFWLELSLNA